MYYKTKLCELVSNFNYVNVDSRSYLYDSVLSWSSFWIVYSAAYQEIANFSSQCLQIITIINGLVSFMHWRWYNHKPLLFIDLCMSNLVFIWHIILIPKTEVLLCAAISAIFFSISCIMKFRQRCLKQGFSLWYLIIHPAFRFFAFWMVMIAHGNEFTITIIVAYWVSIFAIYGLSNRNKNRIKNT